jgi:NADH-quinone oxidoreductase subunit G
MTDTATNAPEAPKKTTLTVTIDGVAMEANPGELLIAAAERTGTYIPRFCWHPRMKEVGMCRMCLVEVSGPRGMSLQPACMMPVAEGMVVDTKSATVKKAQDGVLEFLLVNHPLDCPVCDKGGECPLQDQTLTFGPGESRFVEEKRHNEKPIPISDLVLLDRERCILCDRCTRFSKEVAGDPLIHFINRGNATEVNTFPDDPFASYFSGNVVQICPVGALTAQPYRFAARPWDLDQVESTCTSCSVGCRVVVQSSGDEITRLQGVDSDPVNWGWLCDKGRFDFESVSSPSRLSAPVVRAARGAAAEKASWSSAMSKIATALRTYQPSQIGFIGGARLTNEDQYAYVRLAKQVLRTDNVDAQLGDGLSADAWLGFPRATINDLATAGAVVLLGPDIKEELPVLFLRLRDAAVNRKVPVVEFAAAPTGVTPYTAESVRYRPGEVAVAAKAVLAAATGTSAERQIGGVEADSINAAGAVLAKAMADGKKVVVVLGRGSMAEPAAAFVEAGLAFTSSSASVAVLPAMRRANLHGALDMGMAPGLLPGRVTHGEGAAWFAAHWSAGPAEVGMDTAAMLQAAADGTIKALVLLGADPVADFVDRELAVKALSTAEFVAAVDTLPNASNAHAHVILPAAGFGEKSGTTTNLEGRVTVLSSKVSAPGTARPDWMIATELAAMLGNDFGYETVGDVTDDIAATVPTHAGATRAELNRPGNADGIVVPVPVVAAVEAPAETESEEASAPTIALPRPLRVRNVEGIVPQPDSYSLRLVTSRVLYDQGSLVQASGSLAKLARPASVRLHSGEVERHAMHPGDVVNVVSQHGQLALTIEVDDALPRGVAVVPWNLGDVGANALINVAELAADGITKVRLESGRS